MATKYPMPNIWVASNDGIKPYDWQASGHHLDIEDDDDTEPKICPQHVIDVLGFDPLLEFPSEEANTHPEYPRIGGELDIQGVGTFDVKKRGQNKKSGRRKK